MPHDDRRWSRRRAVALAVFAALGWSGLVLPAAAARPRRAGEIVRLERPRITARVPIQICPVILPGKPMFTCFGGRAPKAGARFTLLDRHGYRGSVRVVRSAPVKPDPCHLESIHDVTFERIDSAGPIAAVTGGRRGDPMVAVRAPGLERMRSRVVIHPQISSPGGKGQSVWMAIDRDGDRAADLVVTAYDCSRAHPPPTLRLPGKRVRRYCIDYWVRGTRWHRAGRDFYLACN